MNKPASQQIANTNSAMNSQNWYQPREIMQWEKMQFVPSPGKYATHARENIQLVSRATKHANSTMHGKTCNSCQARENMNSCQVRENMNSCQAWRNIQLVSRARKHASRAKHRKKYNSYQTRENMQLVLSAGKHELVSSAGKHTNRAKSGTTCNS